MTTDACRIRTSQAEVTIRVTLVALERDVCARQREPRRGVIKGRVVPRSGVVTLLARRREARGHVIRIGRAVEILYVTRRAIGGRVRKLSVDVALGARDRSMRSRQRELGKGVVIESRRIPGARVVASLAGGREAGLRVRRVVGLIEVRQVATGTVRAVQFEVVVHVALIAHQVCMCPGQRESSQ